VQKALSALCLVALAVLAFGPLRGLSQETARRVSDAAPSVGTLNHVPLQSKCTSGLYENAQTGERYWQTKGITVFNDGYEAVHTLYRGAFRTKKEMQKQRRKGLTECANWLDSKGD
jgi:hypothetical protein